ncbi:universal stress protein [Legionella yabuuchiae]|uniref:universal stress protein n=1 Tax=Legionella yabuuchiae TaxID=376727 RepID=UPI001054737E|nr:universal stress protein [Legionella yabuuchiae]
MEGFQNIVLVTHGLENEKDAFQHAVKLATDNRASLTILVIHPIFPTSLKQYQPNYERALIDSTNRYLKEARDILNIPNDALRVKIELEQGNMPDVRVIRHVLKQNYDLVIKHAKASEDKGFDALEMELLHKSPSPIFISKPFKHEPSKARVAVAIDPNEETPEGQQLSIDLLKISHALAKHFSGELDVISCWHFAFENYFRNSVFDKTSTNELNEMLQETKNSSKKALDRLLAEVKMDKINCKTTLLKGRPEEQIPSYIDDQRIDILVMGTLARTGISGFIIGNTAENVLQKIDCSLLALKPSGFVSPVKLD